MFYLCVNFSFFEGVGGSIVLLSWCGEHGLGFYQPPSLFLAMVSISIWFSSVWRKSVKGWKVCVVGGVVFFISFGNPNFGDSLYIDFTPASVLPLGVLRRAP